MVLDFNRVTKLYLNGRISEAMKKLQTKNQVQNALHLGDKNKEKVKHFKCLI